MRLDGAGISGKVIPLSPPMKKTQAAIIFGTLCLAVLTGSQTLNLAKKARAAAGEGSAGETDISKPEGTRDGQSLSSSMNNGQQDSPAQTFNLSEPGSNPTPKWSSLKEMMSWDSHDLEVTRHPDGHTSVYGGGRFTQMAAGVRDASGKMIIQCFGDYTALDETLSGRKRPSNPVPAPLGYEVSDY